MKISAIPQAQGGNPSQNLLSTAQGTATGSKLAAAKAIAAGETPIKVTPVDPQVARVQQAVNKIKMRTNANPMAYTPDVVEEVASESVVESPIAATNETATPIVEDTRPLSPQLAALAKQRRALQVKERDLGIREAALAAAPQSTDLSARLKDKTQTLSVLQEHGITYDVLTEAILANQNGVNPEIQQLKAELQALKAGVDKSFTDRDTQAETQVLADMQREATALSATGDDYSMVRETQSIPDVMDLIRRTYKASGEVLDVTEALQLIEADLVQEALKIANIEKIRTRAAPAPQRTLKTLTNRDGTSVPLDRKTRAIMAMNGTLRK